MFVYVYMASCLKHGSLEIDPEMADVYLYRADSR